MSAAKSISRRDFLATSAVVMLAPAWAKSAASEKSLNFAAVGDWGKENTAFKVAAAMGDWATRFPLRAVISTGDNFYPSGVVSVADPLWRARYEDVFSSSALQCPWYPVLGNHDHRGNVDAQIEYSRKSTRWQMPGRYYSRSEPMPEGGAIDFFFIDTTPIFEALDRLGGSILPFDGFIRDQFRWLDEALASSSGTWKIVVGHHPVFSGGRHGNTRGLIDHLKPILDRNHAHIYLNGHDHDLQHILVDNIHYLTCGAGAEARITGPTNGTVFAASSLGFLTARATEHAIFLSFVNDRGQTLHEFTVSGAGAAYTSKLRPCRNPI